MSKKISAELFFTDNNNNMYNFIIKNYLGYTYENKTKSLKLYIDDKLCIFRDINFDSILVEIFRRKK